MKTTRILMILVMAMCLVLCSTQISFAAAVGTAFTVQGRLVDGEDAADGPYDMQFGLYDANVDGNQLGTDVNIPEVDVIDGYFTAELDFGAVFDGNEVWLKIGVRPGDQNDPNTYSIFDTRQRITPAPYALYATSFTTSAIPIPLILSGSHSSSIITAYNSGGTVAIDGTVSNVDATGVSGAATSTTGDTAGVVGWSYSSEGKGVLGYASSSTGTNYGIIGQTGSSDGWSAPQKLYQLK